MFFRLYRIGEVYGERGGPLLGERKVSLETFQTNKANEIEIRVGSLRVCVSLFRQINKQRRWCDEFESHQEYRERVLNLFRQMDSTIPSQVISVFLVVARFDNSKELLETRRIPDMVDLSHAATQRALAYLGDVHWKDKKMPGLGLIQTRVSGEDARQRVVELSTKGRWMVHQIEEALNNGRSSK